MDKIFFIDLGIRNAVINNFNHLSMRADVGSMWENFLLMERTKHLDYTRDRAQQFFWRKYSGAEVDYVETKDDHTNGYEFKWKKKKSRTRHSWLTDYPDAEYMLVNQENWIDFIEKK